MTPEAQDARDVHDSPDVLDSPEAGFTLAETLVAMTVVVLLSGFALAAYSVATRALARWDARTTLSDTAHVVRQRLALDLQAATRVAIPAPDSLLVWTSDSPWTGGSTSEDPADIVFVAQRGVLTRNGVPAHREAVDLERFVARAVSASGDTLRRVERDAQPALVLVQAVFAADTLTVATDARVALRTVPRWTDSPDR